MPHPREPRADLTWSPSGKTLTVREGRSTWNMHDPGGRIARHLRRGRAYEQKLLRIMAQEQGTGGVFVDVGAHVGNHTLYMASVTGCDVYAFEALPYNAARLEANVQLNGLRDCVHVAAVAAGAESGTADWRGGRYLSLDGNLDGDVPVEPVDDWVPPDADVRVVKIDVEGFEPQALAGMPEILDNCRPVIWCEAHTDNETAAQGEILHRHGYQFDRYLQLGSRMARWNPDGTRRPNWRMARWSH